VRDLVLGIKAVDGNGNIIKAGGKVVKNVAGYDLSKIFIGALGTLGIITEINMKTYPLPEYESTLIIQSNNLNRLTEIAKEIQKYSHPTGLELINNNFSEELTHGSECEWSLLVRYLGYKISINEQTSKDKKIHEKYDVKIQEVDGINSKKLWKKYQKILLLNVLKEYSPLIYFEPSLGIIHIQINSKSKDISISEIINIRNAIENKGGILIIENTTNAIKNEIDTWGNYNKNIDIMNQIKNAFDENNTLSPGRFFGGI